MFRQINFELFCALVLLVLLLLQCQLSSALEVPISQSSVKVTTVHQFPNNTWLENLTQRPDGTLLITELYNPNLWQVNPAKPANQKPILVTKVAGKMGLYGVTELDALPDNYAFSAGNLSMSTNGSPFVRGSFSMYSINLKGKKVPQDFPVSPQKLSDFPDAGVLNGLTSLPPSSTYPEGALLSADGILGVIWVLDLATLKPKVWSRDPFLAICPPGLQGVNGVKYAAARNRVYFTNTGCGWVASIQVNQRTAQPVGRAEIAGGETQGLDLDDFDISLRTNGGGTAFVSDLNQNQIFAVDLIRGEVSSVAGSVNSTQVAHPTAVKVGRSANDRKQGTIYVTTTGGLPSGINGVVVGGQVLAVKGAINQ